MAKKTKDKINTSNSHDLCDDMVRMKVIVDGNGGKGLVDKVGEMYDFFVKMKGLGKVIWGLITIAGVSGLISIVERVIKVLK